MTPILYSFRRCPYAMRARLALAVSGVGVELREILLRDKPQAFLDASPTATVPCLVTPDGVIDESLDIMIWALKQSDPEGWLDMPQAGADWISRADGPFKQALDQTKYATRYPEVEPEAARARACEFLNDLNDQIESWIFERPALADYAILPFVRQFAFIDKGWFDAQDWPRLQNWLARFLASDRFEAIMMKYDAWQDGDPAIRFP
ncbi:glutathione S-transferase [uncultured Roseobacter sp.]|uniref:glutathione S-transferase n=1 Tax=uncultured Roseobacter sp. TaxID=114847 RepID=UPI00262AA379|nr:glutathione S-transferase [uncultured Roseobacter sp.]